MWDRLSFCSSAGPSRIELKLNFPASPALAWESGQDGGPRKCTAGCRFTGPDFFRFHSHVCPEAAGRHRRRRRTGLGGERFLDDRGREGAAQVKRRVFHVLEVSAVGVSRADIRVVCLGDSGLESLKSSLEKFMETSRSGGKLL